MTFSPIGHQRLVRHYHWGFESVLFWQVIFPLLDPFLFVLMTPVHSSCFGYAPTPVMYVLVYYIARKTTIIFCFNISYPSVFFVTSSSPSPHIKNILDSCPFPLTAKWPGNTFWPIPSLLKLVKIHKLKISYITVFKYVTKLHINMLNTDTFQSLWCPNSLYIFNNLYIWNMFNKHFITS